MAKWIQALRQTTTYLGLVVIAIIWGGIYLLSSEQRQLAYDDALRQGSNLARVLEEYIRRVVQESDNALLALRQDYQHNPQNFDLAAWVARTQSHNNLTAHFGITDAKGFVTLSSHGPVAYSVVYCGSSPLYVPARQRRRRALHQRPADRAGQQATYDRIYPPVEQSRRHFRRHRGKRSRRIGTRAVFQFARSRSAAGLFLWSAVTESFWRVAVPIRRPGASPG